MAFRGVNRDRGYRKLIWIERQLSNQAEFIGLTGTLAFDPSQFPESSVPVQPVKGQTACYRKAQLTSR